MKEWKQEDKYVYQKFKIIIASELQLMIFKNIFPFAY